MSDLASIPGGEPLVRCSHGITCCAQCFPQASPGSDGFAASVRANGELARRIEELTAELAQARLALASCESQCVSFIAEKEQLKASLHELAELVGVWKLRAESQT
jgi:hypothetical protein